MVSAANALLGRVAKALRATAIALRHAVLALTLAWASLSLYFSNLLSPFWRVVCAIAFAGFGIWVLWVAPRRSTRLVLAAASVVVLAMWFATRPSHDRQWRADVAVMPRAVIDGDRVRIVGVRDFNYRHLNDFTPHYEDRELELSHLTGVDFYISYWMPGPVAHTFLSFVFDNAPPLAVSIEARPEIHEGFSPLGSLFKKFELIYVVGDERDLVHVRTNHRGEEVFLYRLRISPDVARRLFLVYLDRINELADRPEFYHLLSNNCTINIVRYASSAHNPLAFDMRFYLNGLSDRFLYQTGRLERSMPFEQLRERAHINALALEADQDASFSERIRTRLTAESHARSVASEKR